MIVMAKRNLGRYVDPRTDFGFRWYFGREDSKQFLIDFLNGLFQGEKVIVDLAYGPNEHDGEQREERRVVFDLHCTGAEGERFIIEMQRLYQDFFKDRMVYYTSRLISKLVSKGRRGNNYELPEVYFIGILEFALDATEEKKYFYDVALCERQTAELFYEKLGFKLIVLPHFNKREDELRGDMDQWLYLLKNLSEMQEMLKFLDKRMFSRIFEVGKVASLKKEEQMSYEASIKQKMDAESIFNSARRAGFQQGLEKGHQEGFEKGREEGHQEGREEGHQEGREEGHQEGHQEGSREAKIVIVRNLIQKTDMTDEQIAMLAEVSLDVVKQIRSEDTAPEM